MAHRLSAYLWLRNEDFANMLEHPGVTTLRKVEEKERLRAILKKLDALHDLSDMVRDDSQTVAGQIPLATVDIKGVTTVIERSRNRRRSGELFLEIHKLLRDKFVDHKVYARLANAHKELGIEPYDEDFKKALEYGGKLDEMRRTWFISTGRVSGSGLVDSFCWDIEVKKKGGPAFRYH